MNRAGFCVEYAIYWHLRQHAAGCEMEHGAILRHDGRPGRIARAIQKAIRAAQAVASVVAPEDKLLVFSFQQHWANESRPQQGTAWDYRAEVEQNWYGGARDALGELRIGDWRDVNASHRIVIAPFLQMAEPGMWEHLSGYVEAGGTLITTADLARLDDQNNVLRQPPLGVLKHVPGWPHLEVFHLRDGFEIKGHLGMAQVSGRIFWAVPEAPVIAETYGAVVEPPGDQPLALALPLHHGRVIVALTALDRSGVAALLRQIVAGG